MVWVWVKTLSLLTTGAAAGDQSLVPEEGDIAEITRRWVNIFDKTGAENETSGYQIQS
ncbi:hypothetical protein ACLB1E_05740 [Escherichia coli]